MSGALYISLAQTLTPRYNIQPQSWRKLLQESAVCVCVWLQAE